MWEGVTRCDQLVDTQTVEFNTTDKQTYMHDNCQISYQGISLKIKLYMATSLLHRQYVKKAAVACIK